MQNSENIEHLLDNDETVRWTGKPQSYSVLDETNKTSTLKNWFLAAILAALLNGGYYMLCISSGLDFKMLFLVFSIGVPLFVFMNPIFERNGVKKQIYAITNKKVITYSEGADPQILALDKIDAVRVEKAAGSNCHMRLGSSTFNTPTGKLRTSTIKGIYDDDSNNKKYYTGLIFYNLGITDSEAVCGLLNPQTIITGRVA